MCSTCTGDIESWIKYTEMKRSNAIENGFWNLRVNTSSRIGLVTASSSPVTVLSYPMFLSKQTKNIGKWLYISNEL